MIFCLIIVGRGKALTPRRPTPKTRGQSRRRGRSGSSSGGSHGVCRGSPGICQSGGGQLTWLGLALDNLSGCFGPFSLVSIIGLLRARTALASMQVRSLAVSVTVAVSKLVGPAAVKEHLPSVRFFCCGMALAHFSGPLKFASQFFPSNSRSFRFPSHRGDICWPHSFQDLKPGLKESLDAELSKGGGAGAGGGKKGSSKAGGGGAKAGGKVPGKAGAPSKGGAGGRGAAAEEEEEAGSGGEVVECQFCLKASSAFSSPEALDLHFFHDCPMLVTCKECGQVREETAEFWVR